ncbi:MAG TPA: hypothetical protein VFF28_07385 [Candidatus Nanoarchaeia archaeon]|nr:hypothetical protein [Candidatus Nanoarchaeia archaeon]
MTFCKTCGMKITNIGHLCNPQCNRRIYICDICGIITTEKDLLCKPKLFKLK